MEYLPNFHEKLQQLNEYQSVFFEESLKYFQDTLEHCVIGILAYLCLCFAFYFVTLYVEGIASHGAVKGVSRVLLVTAHPDDECMFFGPTVIHLTNKKDCEIYLLCLSDGNFDKKGATRKRELWEACKILGIPDSNVTIIKSDLLPDCPNIRWREEIVGGYLLSHIESYSIDTVITFDRMGISRHQNHVSIFYAVAYLCMERKLPPSCKAYVLESINVLRKYSFFLDLPISYLLSSHWYSVSPFERRSIKAAMRAHASQYVWFRQLYMVFSRYTYTNTLKEVEIIDLELEMDLEE